MKDKEQMTYQELIQALIDIRDEVMHDKLEDELFERLDLLKEAPVKKVLKNDLSNMHQR